MRTRFILCLAGIFALWAAAAPAAEPSFEEVAKSAMTVYELKRMLRPFVAACDDKPTHFGKLFCSALNERLKAQHQSKVYINTFEPSEAGPLVVQFKAKPTPVLEVQVRGCLTCAEPMLEKEGGDVSKGRFFVFKEPQDIKIRRGKILYDLGDIDLASYKADLPKDTTEKKFRDDILPHLRLDLIYRPVAGVNMVGARFKYGVVNFELLGHRAYDKCAGTVFGASPVMAQKFPVDKDDLSCPQNQPKKAVARPTLPSTLPQTRVKEIMERVSEDLQACYEQFGASGDVPVDLVVAPDGKVKIVKVTGGLAGTPTGQCVERLVKHLAFPKFSGRDARLQWPFSLK